jgi:DNA sulfur modification protein DndD
MILERIVLRDVGVYRGEHVIDLAPPTRRKPVILFGGLNGGGKTTLQDAIQFALYGCAAQCSNRGALGYEEFLRRSIHRGVDVRDGAAIEIDLTHTFDGELHAFQVRRSWSARESHVRDQLEVSYDGVFDPVLTDAWPARIEEMIPARLAPLFFFDGEKIEALADPARSAEVLSTAIHVLLGLDVLDQLTRDLAALERRKTTQRKSALDRNALEGARREAEQLAGQHQELVIERDSALEALERAARALVAAEERFKLAGGEAFERQRDLEDQHAAVEARLRRHEDKLREEARGPAPLLLVAGLLERIYADDEAERARREVEELGAMLAARDTRTLAVAEAAGATRKVLGALAELFSVDRRPEGSPGLGLSTEARGELANVRISLCAEVSGRIARLLEETAQLIVERDELDRRLAGVPAEEAIVALKADCAHAREQLERARGTLRAVEADLERTIHEEGHRWDQYRRLLTKNVEEGVERQSCRRIVTHAARVRETMARFRGALLGRRVGRIEQLILEGFQHLLRKDSLVSGLRVDPETFTMTLVAVDGSDLSPERLSAGERQLLAVSTLWGLARASGRRLPVVIDAPLGRLDSAHRRRLLERYVPHASHQVILLATDEEIDLASYARLEPSIGRAYTLRFDDRTASTTVEHGYFR